MIEHAQGMVIDTIARRIAQELAKNYAGISEAVSGPDDQRVDFNAKVRFERRQGATSAAITFECKLPSGPAKWPLQPAANGLVLGIGAGGPEAGPIEPPLPPVTTGVALPPLPPLGQDQDRPVPNPGLPPLAVPGR